MRLNKKVAVITAGGSGSGRAGALIFSREGAKVVVGDIDAAAGKETVEMVRDQGGESIYIQMDAGKVEDNRRLIDAAVHDYGKVDILWNHAGIPGPGLLEETEEADFVRSWEVNCKGGFFAAKFAAPHMKKTGGGSIIFTGSTAGLRGGPSPGYASFKGAVVALTWSLAGYLGPYNIRVNCICPGLIDSPMGRVFLDRKGLLEPEALEKKMQDFGKSAPLGRMAKPEDVANTVLFLASDEGSYLNGIVVPVDGGTIVRF
jgi:NAD(P)-dependent dehydrogenase (short-subunit alcohol dehydrogenase family)